MERRLIFTGLIAGLASGLAASWAMGRAHALIVKSIGWQNQEQREDPTVIVAGAVSRPILDRDLTAAEKKTAGPLVHYLFGSSMAATYALIAEFAPSVTAGAGIPFGAAVWLGAHVIALPALRLAPPITQSDASSEAAELASHLLYGAVTELTRSRIRSLSQG